MASLLKLRQAARLIGVSPGRLYRAIADGRLAAAPGGGPGKPTLVSLEALQAFCQREGLRVPDEAGMLERSERLERSGRSERGERSITPADEVRTRETIEALASQYLAQMLARQSDYMEMFVREELSHLVSRVVEHVVAQMAERFTVPQTARPAERAMAMPEASADEDLLSLLKALLPQKRYLRDLGVETLPLARLNARLAPLGYVIDAQKVRDARRFVACTDAYGQVEPFGLFELRPVAEEMPVAERAERPERSERPEHSAALPEFASPSKADLLTWVRTFRGSGMSLQTIADELNARGVPTLSGKGRWQKGTIGHLLAQKA